MSKDLKERRWQAGGVCWEQPCRERKDQVPRSRQETVREGEIRGVREMTGRVMAPLQTLDEVRGRKDQCS